MITKTFSVAITGFTPIEHRLFASVFKLAQARTLRPEGRGLPVFERVELPTTEKVDIFLVDGDSDDAMQIYQQYDPDTHKPAIIVSDSDRKPSLENQHILTRRRLGGTLLKQLDSTITQYVNSKWSAPNNKQCLVVDDSQLVRAQMELFLQDYQLDIAFAEDAETALNVTKQKSFDLIFLDVMLPEMDGYKACKLLKSDPNTSATPVIMLTSKKSPFNKMHGALVGCDKYLTKPIDPEKVHQVLAQYAITPNELPLDQLKALPI